LQVVEWTKPIHRGLSLFFPLHGKIKIYIIIFAVEGKGMSSQKEKEEWSEKHARRIQQRFEQWQKPLGIDSEVSQIP
jgi:hypothetical protein